MARGFTYALAAAAALAMPAEALAMDGVVASIKPVHSLVAAVMGDTGTPRLLVSGNASPHTYALKPSDAAALQGARLVFWVGPGLEAFLGKPLDSLASQATVVELSEDADLSLLPFREGGPFEAHDHGEHDHEGGEHDAHGGDHDHKAAHDGDEHDHDHDEGAFDMHVWLDPENARAMTETIREALSDADPANAATYAANARHVEARLDRLTADLAATLAPVKDRPFVVFHDAYQYFERRFGVTVAGSITVSPEVTPGADRLSQIRAKVKQLGATCVFAEPQFEPRLVNVVIEGTGARAGTLDPEGGSLTEGPDLYFDLVGNIAKSLAECLGRAS